MLSENQKQRNEIRKSFFCKNYINTINLCKKLIKKLKKIYGDYFQDVKKDLGFCYYYISRSYKKLKNIKESIRYAKKAVKHGLNQHNEENNFSIEAKILLAENYECINRINKSMKNYKRCDNFYKEINCNDNRRQMIFKIAKLIKSPKTMLKIIKLNERENNPEITEDIIEEYLELIDYHIKENNLNQIAILISDIEDIKVKLEVAGALKNLVEKIA